MERQKSYFGFQSPQWTSPSVAFTRADVLAKKRLSDISSSTKSKEVVIIHDVYYFLSPETASSCARALDSRAPSDILIALKATKSEDLSAYKSLICEFNVPKLVEALSDQLTSLVNLAKGMTVASLGALTAGVVASLNDISISTNGYLSTTLPFLSLVCFKFLKYLSLGRLVAKFDESLKSD